MGSEYKQNPQHKCKLCTQESIFDLKKTFSRTFKKKKKQKIMENSSAIYGTLLAKIGFRLIGYGSFFGLRQVV